MPASREAEASALQATGSVASIAGRHEEAVDAFSAALGLRPDDATLLCDRSAALFALGRCEAALVDASRAVELRPRWGRAHGQHGAVLVALNCRKDAIAAYERATKCSAEESSAIMMQTELSRLRALEDEHNDGSTPTASSSDGATSGIPDTDALQAMGTEAFKAGDYLLAKDKWSAALLRRPDDATLLSNRSAAWLALGEKRLALDDATRCVQRNPRWYKGYGRLGAAYDALGLADESLAAYAKGLDLEPGSAVLKGELERIRSEAAQRKAELPSSGQGSAADAAHNDGTSGGVSLTGLALAKECNRLGRPQQAVRELDKLLAKKATDGELYCERSLAHASCHRLALAHEDASTAVYLYGQQHDPDIKPWENAKELGVKLMTRHEKNELAKKEGRAYLLRGQAEVRLCDYDAAMRTFQLGCKADARLGPEALKELREAWYAAKELCRGWRRAGRMKKLEKKRVAFAAERKPVLYDIAKFEREEDKAVALRNLAGLHSKWEMHEDAIELLSMALHHAPEDQLLAHQRAREHVKMGNYELALPDAQQVARARPGWIEGLIHLGNIEGELCQWSAAAAHWHEALRLQPHNPILRQKLERATVEMGPEEAASYTAAVSQWQTGDRTRADGDGGAVELEEYEENGRFYYRPKGPAGAGGDLEASQPPPSAPSHPEFLKKALGDLDAAPSKPRVVGEAAALKKSAAPRRDDDWGHYASARPKRPLLGRSVIIDGLIARPELNGSRGVASSFNDETMRYNVQLPKGEVVALKADNLSAATEAMPTGDASDGGQKPPTEAKGKTSIGARMAAKRNAKGIAWAKGGIGGTQESALSGMFATDEKKRDVEARRAAQPIDEGFDEFAEAEAERLARLTPQEREQERKAVALKELATKHMSTLNTMSAIKYLTDAIKLRPTMKELWSNRSHAYELQHVHDKALADGEKTIELAPEWPKGYLRTARALMSLERGAEAAAQLRRALELAPRDSCLLSAYKEAMVLADCTRRTERAIRASQLPTFNGVGDSDVVDISRGCCTVKGCDCNAFIQKHGRTTVHLLGRGHVRQDNDETFFNCARCGHDSVRHRDLRDVAKARKAKPAHTLPSAPKSGPNERMAVDTIESVNKQTYTNSGIGTRGGIDSSYYYAAVGKDQHQVVVDSRLEAVDADKDEWGDDAIDDSFVCADADPFGDAPELVMGDPLEVTTRSSAAGDNADMACSGLDEHDPLAQLS